MAGRDPAALQGCRAGIVSRVLAVGVDFAVVGLLWVGCLATVWVVGVLVTGDLREFPSPEGRVSAVGTGVIVLAYLSYWWATTGSTVGGQLLGLRVVTDGGSRLPFARALARAAICLFLGPVVLLWAAVSRRNAGLHDLVLRTSVVHAWGHPPAAPRAPRHG
ncbi:MAG: hypothetical protein KatS3mg009_0442 [Acidimicrobiia bacterium]|nr:MAG: hypothetical protein KatS3mg009_0442 [Acidimicrobiia bacterium]